MYPLEEQNEQNTKGMCLFSLSVSLSEIIKKVWTKRTIPTTIKCTGEAKIYMKKQKSKKTEISIKIDTIL